MTSPRFPRPCALLEVDAAIQHLFRLVHERWHPRHEDPDPETPDDVRDALADLREITLELKGLWDYLRAQQSRAA
ncbi:MAG: hypothetical protein R3F62_23335 [Planctomycetota bacterium]